MRGLKSLLFAASAIFCLLLPNAQATTHHAPLPPGASFVFTFPGYTSLHDCSFFQDKEQPLSAEACIGMLQKEQKTAEKDTEYAKSEFFRSFIGEFGEKPLLYDKATIIFCKDGCRELKPQRSGPPEMMWRPPQIDNQSTRLIYPLAHSVPKEKVKLSLLLADGEWRSNLFAGDFWHHNYMRVHLDESAKQLIIERDWKETLSDLANYRALWQDISMFMLTWIAVLIPTWIVILFLAIPGLLLAKWHYHWRWKQAGCILSVHAKIVILTIIFTAFAMQNSPGGVLALPAYLLVYFIGMLPEWRLSKQQEKLESRHILIALTLMRLPATLLLIMIFVYS